MIQRKILAGFLSVVMLLTLLPVQVFASTGEGVADGYTCTSNRGGETLGGIYDGEPYTVTVTKTDGSKSVPVTYHKDSTTGEEVTAPTNAGTYYVMDSDVKVCSYTIEKRQPVITVNSVSFTASQSNVAGTAKIDKIDYTVSNLAQKDENTIEFIPYLLSASKATEENQLSAEIEFQFEDINITNYTAPDYVRCQGTVTWITPKCSWDGSNDSQNLIQGSGEFIEPTFESNHQTLGDEEYTIVYHATVTGTSSNTSGNYDTICQWLKNLPVGIEVRLTWTFESNEYTYVPKSDTIWIYIKQVQCKIGETVVTTQEQAIDTIENPTYGHDWDDIFQTKSGLQCYVGNEVQDGTFRVEGESNPPQAGTVNATLYFETSPGIRYEIMDLTATVAPAKLTVTWKNTENRVYGDNKEVDYTVSGEVNNDDLDTVVTASGLDADTAGVHTATLTITGTNNYVFASGTKTTSTNYTIDPKLITDVGTISVTQNNVYHYTGQPIVPSSSDFAVTFNGESVADDEYTISFPDDTDHTNVSAAIPLTLTFNKNYSGTYNAATFKISQKQLDESNVTVSGIADSYEYTGQAIHPEVIITHDGKQLKKDTDYEVAYGDGTEGSNIDVAYNGNQEATDEGKVNITFINNYEGSITETFDIDSAPASGTILLTTSSADGTYSGGSVITASPAPGSHVSWHPSLTANSYTYNWYFINENNQAEQIFVNESNPAVGPTYQINKPKDTQIFVELTSEGNYEGKVKSNIIVVGTKPLPDDVISVQKGDTSATEAVAGDVLTAAIGGGLTLNTDYTLQWYRDGDKITGATGATYTVTAADKGTMLSVAVIGMGDYSGEAFSDGVTVAATAPSAPTVTATADDAKVTIRWSVADDGGSQVTGYQVSCDNTNWISLEPSQTQYTFTGLTNGTEYTLYVKAINSVDTSEAGTATATPIQPEEPTDPDPDPDPNPNPGGGSTGGGSTGGSTVEKPVTSGNTTTITTVVRPNISGDTAKAEISSSAMNQKVEAVLNAAKKNNTQPSIVIDVAIPDGKADGFDLTLPSGSLKELGNAGGSLTITSPVGSITMDDKSLTSIGEQSGVKTTITLETADKSNLTEKQLKKIGDRPVYELSIYSNGEAITHFGGGKAEVTLPYELKEGENPNRIVVYYVDDEGNLHRCNTKYDAATKTVSFETTHFSLYMIGMEQENPFVDVDENGWAYEYILDLYDRGIIGGIGDGQFAPERSITRAEFVKILCGVAGGDTTAANAADFTDVAADAWYAPFVAWAVEYGVTTGTSPETFSPDASITRQEMAAMIYRYADMAGVVLPETETPIAFTDSNSFADWAADAISAMQMAGIINGVGDGSFAPTSNATRQETCKMLSIFLQIVTQ